MKSIGNELIQLYLLILCNLNEIYLEFIFILYLYMYLNGTLLKSIYLYLLMIYQWNLIVLTIYLFIGIYLNVFLWNLSVHVFIKLILLKLIYFDGRACYIGKINLYMYKIVSSFVLDLIVKAVIVAGAACSSLLI